MRKAPRIAVIDDSALIRDLLERYLTRRGFAVETYGTCEAALQGLLAEPSVHAIVLDLRFPPGCMSGRDFLCVREDEPALGAVPVVLCSGIDSGEDLAGVAPFLEKPFDLAHLARMLEQLIEER